MAKIFFNNLSYFLSPRVAEGGFYVCFFITLNPLADLRYYIYFILWRGLTHNISQTMKKILSSWVLGSLLLVACNQKPSRQPADYVNPFIGTSDSRWMMFPGPSMPFGMVKLSPDNTDEWLMDAGYEDSIKSICGFGHVHSWMMGSFLMMPTTGPLKIVPGTKDDPDSGYRSRIREGSAQASPGFYSAALDDYHIKAELTSTVRAGFQRYTFPKTDEARVLIDLDVPEEGRPKIISTEVSKISDTEIAGAIHKITNWNEYTLHFFLRFSKPMRAFGTWKGDDPDSLYADSHAVLGAFAEYGMDEGEELLVQSGISYVSVDQARLNMETELGPFGWDFDAVRQNARDVWNDLLGKIKVEGGTEEDKTKFYTNFYRSYCSRTIFSDVNGKYADACEEIKQTPDPQSPMLGSDAFWMTFWNLNQLWSLATPEMASAWAKTQLQLYDDGGWLNKGAAGLEYSGIMVAEHEISLLTNAYQKGIRDFDIEKAYKAMKEIQTTPSIRHPCGGYAGNGGLTLYENIGFIPANGGPVSNTLEYAFDDWCVAQLARALGKMEDYERFMKRSQNYRNVFDPSTKYMRPKYRGGPWYEEFNPNVGAIGKEDNFGTKDFVEANAWQFTWFVPHDLGGLVDLIGKEEFNRRLEEGFQNSLPNFTSPYVNHSNQPNMQAAWLFNYSGKPWLTQYWVREVLDKYYGSTAKDGYPGDEDQGQMGAWYVMSAMGLFEMDGGSSVNPVYELSGPLFEKITISLDQKYYPGNEFIIEARGASSENRYIQSATLNGRPLDTFWFSHSDLVGGGRLVLEMGPAPNKSWAASSPLPHSYDLPPIVTTPYLHNTPLIFVEEAAVTMACDTEGASIHYTTDGSAPDENSTAYTGPFMVTNTTNLKMVAYVNGIESLSSEATVEKALLAPASMNNKALPGLKYRYYHGDYTSVRGLAAHDLIKSGTSEEFSLAPKEREQYFGLEFEGYVDIPQDGIYTFYLASNDGSQLYLDGQLLVNNDGLHPYAERYANKALKRGLHPVFVSYFQAGGQNVFSLKWKGPGREKEEIGEGYLFH